MILNQVVNPLHYSPFEALAGKKIWQREVGEVTERELMILHYRIQNALNKTKADAAIKFLVERINEVAEGSKLKSFRLPAERITSEEFNLALQHFTVAERRCILFALTSKRSLSYAINLKWGRLIQLVNARAISKYEHIIALSMPRHLMTDLVFWQQGESTALPLVGIIAKVSFTFNCSWEELQERFDNMIFIDSSEFMEKLKTIIQ